MRHGTTDSAGTFHPQLVHLGVTQSGQPGLFTGNTLAWPITPMLYDGLKQDPVGLRLYAEQKGFTLEDRSAS